MATRDFDVIVIGAGIAGASAAYELSASAKVAIAEAESQPGYHASGRSAAYFFESYGNTVVRALTRASRAFLLNPPPGFCGHPLMSPRNALFIARPDQVEALRELHAAVSARSRQVRLMRAEDALAMVPALRRDYLGGAMLEPGAMELDAHALLQGFLRGARSRGSVLLTGATVSALARVQGNWEAQVGKDTIRAPLVVNAAGAWASKVGEMAGASAVQIRPLKRTACILDPGPEFQVRGWPMVADVGEQFYFKPDAGLLLLSPADETPSEPCDAYPEEEDVALAVERLERATSIRVKTRITRQWAGLRSFAPDRSPVVGFDPLAEGFFWVAGQGGYGIQSAPAMGAAANSLLLGRGWPGELEAQGVLPADLSPERFFDSSPAAL
jgi:D-arginine dehydrogenase